VGILSNRLVKVIRFVFPILFWGIVLQIVRALNSPIFARLAKWWELSSIVLLVLGTIALISVTLFILRESLLALRPNREIRKQIPSLVNTLLARMSGRSEEQLVKKVGQLLVRTYSQHQFRSIRLVSEFAKASQRKRLQRFKLILALSNLLFFVAGASVTVEIYLLVVNQVAPFFADIAFLSQSLLALITILIILSVVDFLEIIREIRTPFWRAIRKALKVPPVPILFRVLEELTINSRIVGLASSIVENIAYAGTAKFSVECPDENTLKTIMQDSLRKQLGPSLLFYYKYGDLYPPELAPYIETLEPNIRDYFKSTQQFALLGITQGRCVLIASVGTEDVRRMSIWTDSYSLTRNIVIICSKEILNYKGSYEKG